MNNFEKYSNLEKGRFIYFLEPHVEPEWIDTELSETSINPVQNWVIFSKFKQLKGAINAESERAGDVEQRLGESIDWVKSAAARVGGNAFNATENEVKLTTTGVDIVNQYTVTLPAATTEKAGVMSAEDKAKLEEAPNLALRALFIAAGAEYNDTDNIIEKTAPWKTDEVFVKNSDGTYTYSEVPAIVEHLPKHYYLNGLGNITEQEMLRIYNYTFALSSATDWTNVLRQVSIRTNIFKDFFYAAQIIKNFNAAFYGATLGVLFFSSQNITVTPTTISYLLTEAKIKRIVGVIDVAKATNTAHIGTPKLLDDFRLKNLKTSVNFSKLSSVYKRSILYLITNAAPTANITITLHADAYARLQNDADIVAALEAQPLVTLVSA